MAFHCIRIVDGVSLVVFISGEARAIVADLACKMLEFRFRCRGRASRWLLLPGLLRYGCKCDRKHQSEKHYSESLHRIYLLRRALSVILRPCHRRSVASTTRAIRALLTSELRPALPVQAHVFAIQHRQFCIRYASSDVLGQVSE